MLFDYSLTHWVTFFTAAILLNLSPGPDFAFILAQTAKRGVKAGFYAMFGIWTGALTHVFFAAVGLSAIIATSATAFTLVKWVGALYLMWLGYQALRSDGAAPEASAAPTTGGELSKIYRQGVLVAALNPKVAIFFLAFLPQFVVDGAGPVSAQLFLHGILILLVAACIEPPLVLIGGKVTGYLKRNAKALRWMDRGLGALFVGLGVKLAMTERL